MSFQQKVLGQLRPAGGSLSDLYTVPVGKRASVTSISICATGVNDTFRISVAINGAANALTQYVYYDVPITANDTFMATVGITLGPGDVVRCYSLGGNLSFNLFGLERT